MPTWSFFMKKFIVFRMYYPLLFILGGILLEVWTVPGVLDFENLFFFLRFFWDFFDEESYSASKKSQFPKSKTNFSKKEANLPNYKAKKLTTIINLQRLVLGVAGHLIDLRDGPLPEGSPVLSGNPRLLLEASLPPFGGRSPPWGGRGLLRGGLSVLRARGRSVHFDSCRIFINWGQTA